MSIAITLKHRPLHSDFVVEVQERIDEILDDPEAMRQVQRLWQKSPVLVFRRQSIEESEQVRLSEYFGPCEIIGRKDILSPYQDQIIYFSTLRYADGRFVGGFAGGDDVDWYRYKASDSTCYVDPTRDISAAGSLRICKFFQCISGNTEVTCPDGTIDASSRRVSQVPGKR